MISTLIALVSCQPLSEAKSPPLPEIEPPVADEEPEIETRVAIPAGKAIVRECYGTTDAEKKSGGRASVRKASGSGSGGGGSPVVAATPAPPPASVASGPTGGAGVGSTAARPSLDKALKGGVLGASKADAPMDGMAELTAAEPAPMQPAKAKAPDADDGLARREQPEEERSTKDESDRMSRQAAADWGATMWLSNDDSMSLASAQRLLWAVQNRGPVSTSEIRPHEFLNYFSFETDPVRRGDTFSVKAAAEPSGDGTLTMAFAVKGVVPKHEPLDLTVVLDRSGSMHAEGRMDYLKRGLHKMEGQLVAGDRVDLVLFDDVVCTSLEDYVVGRDSPALLTDAIEQLQPRGSTDLDAGLREGYRIANGREHADGRNARMLLISDALLNTGEVDEAVVSEVATSYEKSGIRLTAVGVGRDFNDKVLDMLSEKGKGAYVYLGSEAVVDRLFGIGFPSLTQTIAHDVRFELDLPPSLAMERFYGEEASTNKDDIQPIHYYAGTTQLFLQDLTMRDARAVRTDPVTLTVHYQDADDGAAKKQVLRTTVGALLDGDTRNLHKGQALMAWTDLLLTRSMGGSPCGEPFANWQSRVETLGDDAEVAWLDGLTSPLCGERPTQPKVVAGGVPLKVKVDSDLPIAEVTLACGGWHATETLGSSDTVARFASAKPGSCTLTLEGNVPMKASVEVPSTGGDLRCMVRGGRMSCS